jgi:hypothetical protein
MIRVSVFFTTVMHDAVPGRGRPGITAPQQK